ncbi:MAG TPA: hypothetical protein EYP68_06325, partial [Candidatus Korarchaeota archaeon]|nr:hypothetical protein [Candidatus Korarchaeota archaeon]
MNETIEQGLTRHKINKEDLVLIARDERYEIYDDRREKKAVIIVKKGSRMTPKGYLFLEAERPKRELGWKLLEYIAKLSYEQSGLVPFILSSKA